MKLRYINLEEIIFDMGDKLREAFPDTNFYSNEQMKVSPEFKFFKEAMKEACHQTLKLAAENAIAKIERDWSGNTGSEYYDDYAIVDRQSILDVIKLIE